MRLSLKTGTVKLLGGSIDGTAITPVIMLAGTDGCNTDSDCGSKTVTGVTGTECGATYVPECGTATQQGTCEACTNVNCPSGIGPDGDPDC